MLNNINQMLTDALGPLGPLLALGFLGVVLVIIALPSLLKKETDGFSKLKEQAQAIKSGKKADGTELRRGAKVDKLEKYAHFLEPKDAETMSASRMKLLRAGYRAKNAVRMFHFSQFALGLGFLALGVIYAMVMQAKQEVSTQFLILSTIIPGAAGYYLPQYWVQRRLQSRQQEIISGFPDA